MLKDESRQVLSASRVGRIALLVVDVLCLIGRFVGRYAGPACGVVVALGGLAGAAGGGFAATGGSWTRPDTFVVFFGITSLIAGALGVLVLLGKFRETVGMTLLIGVGTLFVGGALSEAQLVAGVLGQQGGEFRSYHGVELRYLMYFQLACAVVGAVLCAAQVWSRRPADSMPLVGIAAIAFAVLGGIVYCVIDADIRGWIVGLPMIATTLAVVVGGVLTIITTAIGGHSLITSFEVANRSDA